MASLTLAHQDGTSKCGLFGFINKSPESRKFMPYPSSDKDFSNLDIIVIHIPTKAKNCELLILSMIP